LTFTLVHAADTAFGRFPESHGNGMESRQLSPDYASNVRISNECLECDDFNEYDDTAAFFDSDTKGMPVELTLPLTRC
jgi:hypothetical protein